MNDKSAGASVIVTPKLFDGTRMRPASAMLLRGGRVVSIGLPGDVPADMPRVDLAPGSLLAPGFIDLQVNGGGGILLNDSPTPENFAAIARAHRRFGTTACLPTLITDSREIMMQAVDAADEARDMPGVLGLHLEGPFINVARKGVHDPRFIRVPDGADEDLLTEASHLGLLLVTLAPECMGRGFIQRLAMAGAKIAAGHSAATADIVHRAAEAGLTGVTHLFNAMSQIEPRAPGLVGAALDYKALYAGIIADGLHVDPINLRIAYRAKGADRLMLVTDAMPSVGAAGNTFTLMGREVTLRDGKLTTADGTLAGAHLDMASAVRNAIAMMGASLEDALIMAARTPAEFLGIAGEFGVIAPGARADFVALDEELQVTGTWIGGEYEAASS